MMSEVTTTNSPFNVVFDPANSLPREAAAAAQFSAPSSIRFLFGGGEDDYEEDNNDPWQKYNFDVLDKIPHLTGLLSLLGSGWIISRVLCDPKRRKRVYHRIMLALSAFDFFLSFWMFMSKWAHPAEDSWCGSGCYGTIRTCEASGFFITLGSIAIPLYNVALSVYYYLVICNGHTERNLKSNFEKYVHFTIPIISLGLATIPLPMDLYNPNFFLCSAVAFGYDEDTQTYDRGTTRATRAYVFLTFLVVMISGTCMVVIMTCICVKVSLQERRSRTYEAAFSNQLRPSMKKEISRSRRSGTTQSRSRAVVTRALLYTVPFFLTWITPTCYFFVSYICFLFPIRCPGPRTTYALQLWTVIFMPLQGFFNAIIYDVLPYFKKSKKNNSDGTNSPTRFFNTAQDQSDGLGTGRSSRSLVSLKDKANDFFKIKKNVSNHDISSDEINNAARCLKNESKIFDLVGDQPSGEIAASRDINKQIQEENNHEESQNMKTNDSNYEDDEMYKKKGDNKVVKEIMTGEDRV